jgi:manganese/iron transport system substrate-binding protein
MKYSVVFPWLVLSFSMGLSACAPTPPGRSAQVVVTQSVLCDLTKQIAQDTIALTCLIPAGADPHLYQPTPDDRRQLESAQLIFYGGYGLEPDLEKLMQSTSATKVAVSEVAVPKPLGAKEPDPHVWHNVRNAINMTQVIAQNLSKLNPSQASRYQAQAGVRTKQLEQLDRWIKSQVATIPPSHRTLVTTHDALGYFSAAYGIPVEAMLGISTEEKPTAVRTKEVIDRVRSKKVPTIFAERSVNPQLIQTIARDAQVKLSETPIYADSLGEGMTYDQMMVSNTKAIVIGLGGQYQSP